MRGKILTLGAIKFKNRKCLNVKDGMSVALSKPKPKFDALTININIFHAKKLAKKLIEIFCISVGSTM